MIFTRPQNITSDKGKTANLTCRTSKDSVNWLFRQKGNREQIEIFSIDSLNMSPNVTKGKFYVAKETSTLFTLIINNVTEFHAGTYECVDDGGFGPERATAELTVKG